MNVNSFITKYYRKNDDFSVQKNKPNSNPISVKPKMSANLYVIEDYENETAFRPQKNKPNSNPISSKAKMNVKSLAGKSGHILCFMFLTAKKFLALTVEVEHNNSKRDSGCSRIL